MKVEKMIREDDIFTKPNCSPMCYHDQVCVECGRERCIKNMMHTRLHGYKCVCGSQSWKPIFSNTTIRIMSNTGSQLVSVTKTGAGFTIKATDTKKHMVQTIHIFEECIPELIKALKDNLGD